MSAAAMKQEQWGLVVHHLDAPGPVATGIVKAGFCNQLAVERSIQLSVHEPAEILGDYVMETIKAIDYYHFGDVVRNINTIAQEIGVVIDVQKNNGENGKVVVVYKGQLKPQLASPYEFEIIGKSPLIQKQQLCNTTW